MLTIGDPFPAFTAKAVVGVERGKEFAELGDHPFFVGTQAHPEFLSRPTRPHPLFSGVIAAALTHAKAQSTFPAARAAASA